MHFYSERVSDLTAHAAETLDALRTASDPEKATHMASYMKDQFAFFGVQTPQRRTIQKPLLAAAKGAVANDLFDIADVLWHQAEREAQYVGCDLLRKHATVLDPDDIARLRTLITSKSWWDTVDALAIHPVGTLVTNHPELQGVMDEWIDDPNIWVARTAILHQLRFKDSVDQARLFGYAERRAGDSEFFIRKALGWALRSYARVAPDAVRTFVESHDDQLSGLTKREALKHMK